MEHLFCLFIRFLKTHDLYHRFLKEVFFVYRWRKMNRSSITAEIKQCLYDAPAQIISRIFPTDKYIILNALFCAEILQLPMYEQPKNIDSMIRLVRNVLINYNENYILQILTEDEYLILLDT